MRNIWTIARREYNLFFISPIAYAIAFMILLIIGIIFYANIVPASLQQYALGIEVVISPLTTLFLFTIPAITMRTIAEEQRNGTLELLLTAPVRDYELVVGKWLGSFLFLLTILAFTLVFPLILNQITDPGIDIGTVITAYLGLILMAGSFLAIGVATSSLFGNQIAAFFLTLAFMLVFWMIGFAADQATGTAAEIIRYLDIGEHFYYSFFQGIIELKDVVYFLSLIALSLMLGTVSVETRRWR